MWYANPLTKITLPKIASTNATPQDHRWAGNSSQLNPNFNLSQLFLQLFSLQMCVQSAELWASTTPPTPRRRSASRPYRCLGRLGPALAHRRPHSPTAFPCLAAQRVDPAVGTTISTMALPPRPPTLPATFPTLAPPLRAVRRARAALASAEVAQRWANTRAAH